MAQVFDIPEEHVLNILDKYEFCLSQLQVCEEECSELIKAISKYIRALQGTTDVTKDEARSMIVEETAHVAITLGMLKYIFDIKQPEIEMEVTRKAQICGFDDSKYSYRCGHSFASSSEVSGDHE